MGKPTYTPESVTASILKFLGIPEDKQFQCPSFCYHPAGEYIKAMITKLAEEEREDAIKRFEM